jgi:DNA-binding SARP family transcriptional activator/predicted ATPase
MAGLLLRMLGTLQVTGEGCPVDFESDKERALLAYLAEESGQSHRREKLAGFLWPELTESAARNNLRRSLSNLRRGIGDRDRPDQPVLLITPRAVQFNPTADVWVDSLQFQALVQPSGRRPTEQLEQATALYHGGFLEGLSVADSPAFEEWILLCRERYRRLMLEALQRLVAGYRSQGAYRRALAAAWKQMALEPWSEEALRPLMELLALTGNRAEALAQYDKLSRQLGEELGLEPSAETKALCEAIRSGAIGAEPAMHLAAAGPVWNLPTSTTPFFGRVRELAVLEERLADSDTRLLTLTGPGGCGKTRLALQAGARFAERDRRALAEGLPLAFPQGVVFVSLASVDTVEGLVPTLADALQLRLEVSQEQLLRFLRRKTLLLILDSFEHLLPETRLVTQILSAAPDVRLVITSRERLQLHGEHVLHLGGLSYPDHHLGPHSSAAAELEACLDAYPALQLLVSSIRRVQPAFSPSLEDLPNLVGICRLVDGLPLGLEMAASWADTISLGEILAETERSLDFLHVLWRDVPDRQRSIRAVFDASWRRLGASEQAIFAQLSVFRGGFSHAAAREVLGPELTSEVLADLVRTSFLKYDQAAARYQIHELLRQFGADELARDPNRQARARDRHSRYYSSWLQPLGPDLNGARQGATLSEIAAELDNVRAACLWAAERGWSDRLDQVWYPLGLYFRTREAYEAGESIFRILSDRLAASPDPGDNGEADRQQATARCLVWRSIFSCLMGQTELCKELADRALAIIDSPAMEGRDTRHERAIVSLQLGYAMRDTDPRRARALFADSCALYEQIGDECGRADALEGIGRVARNLRDLNAAESAVMESLRLRQAMGNQIRAAESIALLGNIALWQARYSHAEQLLRASLRTNRWSLARFYLSQALLLAGRFGEACPSAAESAVHCLDSGTRREGAYSLAIEGRCHQHLGDYSAARRCAEEALDLARATGFDRGIGSALALLGAVALAQGLYEDARRLCEESCAAWQRSIGHPSELGGELACLALAAQGLGRRQQAWDSMLSQLAWARESGMQVPALFGVAGAALLLADRGEIRRAVEVYALASRHPFVANSRWFEDVVGNPLAALGATLPVAPPIAAGQRGAGRGLATTVGDLISELRR